MQDVVNRFRALAELVADPALDVYKQASLDALSLQARTVLARRCRALLDHLWARVQQEYDITRGSPFCVVYQNTRLCVVLVTSDTEKAVNAAANWASKSSIAVVVGDAATVFDLNDRAELVQRSMVVGSAEAWLALPAALTYVRPPWLETQATAPTTAPTAGGASAGVTTAPSAGVTAA